jgi:tetratricopeptide (TPR) repeat protein
MPFNPGMKVWIFTLFSVPVLLAADSQQMALSLKAQADFDRVALSAIPPLHDTIGCVQSQAALLPRTLPADAALVQYRLGFCALAGATLSHDPAEFATAAGAFDKAIQAWPARARDKLQTPVPVSSGLRVLAALARMQAGSGDAAYASSRQELTSALEAPACQSNLMSVGRCESVLDLGREWLGYLSLRDGDLDGADRNFPTATAPAWVAWAFGKRAFQLRSYAKAAADFRRAIELWESKRDAAEVSMVERLAPQPDMAAAYTDLGGAQLLAGDPAAAIANLTRAIKENPAEPQPYYLRANAREAAGQVVAALADYNLASRTAFAAAKDLASGEAHLYRGILLYRRKEYARAEDEFSSAMNFEIPPALKSDAESWRYLAAVASGACEASRQLLERSLPRVTPYFPEAEARTLLAGCPALATSAGDREGQ